jgi:hypothetical protein
MATVPSMRINSSFVVARLREAEGETMAPAADLRVEVASGRFSPCRGKGQKQNKTKVCVSCPHQLWHSC